jgi:hypothetical protein
LGFGAGLFALALAARRLRTVSRIERARGRQVIEAEDERR